jgi:Flp pilus assembly pilin Flp
MCCECVARNCSDKKKRIKGEGKMLKLYTKAWIFKQRVMDRISKLRSSEEGATIAEYALVLTVVVVGLILVLQQLTTTLQSKILEIVTEISNAKNP